MPEQLGEGGAGTGLPRDDAQGLRLPGPEVVIAYAAEVFEEFSRTLDRLEAPMLALEASPGRLVGTRVIYYWEHAARHLGMVEALRGVLGESGSARASRGEATRSAAGRADPRQRRRTDRARITAAPPRPTQRARS
jgi:hypothetical protein